MSHVERFDNGEGSGVYGQSDDHIGVDGRSFNYIGVFGRGGTAGVYGCSQNAVGVDGESYDYVGVYGHSYYYIGVNGVGDYVGVDVVSVKRTGVRGYSYYGDIGVDGESPNGIGVWGHSYHGTGLHGYSYGGTGVYGFSDGHNTSGIGVFGGVFDKDIGYAAYLAGRVHIDGPLEKPGGSFKIDHPLDPANKYLHHSFVESPDMKNVYDSVVTLDYNGEAEIELQDWFGVLNKDFRYQLTAIGAPGPNLYIAEEISDTNTNNSRFKIAGGTSGMKVSWQVTGIRNDPWANAHRVEVEEDKPDRERGYYIHPELYGQPAGKRISRLLVGKTKSCSQVITS